MRSDVRLRAFRPDEADTVWRVARAAGDGFAPGSERPDRQEIERRVVRSGELVDGRLDLAIEADGRLVGEVDARSPRGSMPSGVFEIGVVLYDPKDRGRGIGREAVARLVRLLFEEHGAERVQASTDVDNGAMQAVLERIRFTREGVMRGFMPSGSGDGRRDYVLYAITRDARGDAWT